MSFEMVDGEEGFVACEREGFGGCRADDESSHQSWSAGGGDEVDVVEGSAAAFEGLAEGGFEVLEVFSGDDLGDDSAVGLCGVRVREGDLCFEDGGLRAA